MFYTESPSEKGMKAPKEIVTYCPKCKKHQPHIVTLYKAGRRRALAKGERQHNRIKKGYGGHRKRGLQTKFAKTSKKQTFKLKCKTCGHTVQKKGLRLKKLTIE